MSQKCFHKIERQHYSDVPKSGVTYIEKICTTRNITTKHFRGLYNCTMFLLCLEGGRGVLIGQSTHSQLCVTEQRYLGRHGSSGP